MKYLVPSSALVISALLSLSATTAFGQAPSPLQPSPATAYPLTPAAGLYAAFGEKAGIRALMDDFVVRLKADPRIGEQFKETDLAHLAAQLTDQVCQLAGGPCVYQGPDMREAHNNIDVTRSHFNALVEVLQQAMDAHQIPFSHQNQLLALLAPMHRDVINTH